MPVARPAGNLISGNTTVGVRFWEAGPSNLVAGNLVGTDVTGELPLGDGGGFGGFGLDVGGSPNNIIGEPGGRGSSLSWPRDPPCGIAHAVPAVACNH